MKRSLFGFTCVSEDTFLGKNLPQPITPDDMKANDTDLKEAIIEFNCLLKKKPKGDKIYEMYSNIIYSDAVCEFVAKIYEKAGWRFVYCGIKYTKSTNKTYLKLIR